MVWIKVRVRVRIKVRINVRVRVRIKVRLGYTDPIWTWLRAVFISTQALDCGKGHQVRTHGYKYSLRLVWV